MSILETQPDVIGAGRARIIVYAPDGETLSHDVTPEDNLIVGSSQNCRIRLEGGDVAAMHCLIRLQDGRLSVQDWYTTAGTYLNGSRIESPQDFAPGDELAIGDYRLTAEVGAEPWAAAPPASVPETPPLDVADAPGIGAGAGSADLDAGTVAESRLDALLAGTARRSAAAEQPVSTNGWPADAADTGPLDTDAGSVAHVAEPTSAEQSFSEPSLAEPSTAEPSFAEPRFPEPAFEEPLPAEPPFAEAPDIEGSFAEPSPAEGAFSESFAERSSDELSFSEGGEHATGEDAERELRRLRARMADLETELGDLREQSWRFAASDAAEVDPFDVEMVELLKAEVEHLQAEVNQRDAHIAELNETGSTSSQSADEHDAELAALVERLERLLEELQAADERAAMLEDLLRAADEAARAEQDERRQLSTWVRDIEERIGEREADWQAENQALQNRINDLTEERSRFNERLRDLGTSQGSAQQLQLIEELREKIALLQTDLRNSEQARATLQQKIESVEFQSTQDGVQKQVEQLMRQERLELAEEFSRLARERAEVARMQSAADQKPSAAPNRPIDEAACRMQAFRQHLRDLHQSEQQQPVFEQTDDRPSTLSSRIANLWKRLDG